MNLFINTLKYYCFPANPIDKRIRGRFKLGLLHYSKVKSWWGITFIQNFIKRQTFQFVWAESAQPQIIYVSGEDHTHLWVANEVLVEKVYDLSKVPFVPDMIFDLGANIGLFSLLTSQKWSDPKLVCVEPHPVTFSYLGANLKANRINAALLACALDASVGFKHLANEGAVFQQVTDSPTSNRIFCLRLDSLIPAVENLKILIKMDIEGAEEIVLSNLAKELPVHCFIFIELHNGDQSVRWVKNWSTQKGFEFVQVRRRGDAIDGYLMRDNTQK